MHIPSTAQLDIAVVTETWPPEVNGVAITLARLVDGLRERGHRLQLVRPRRAGETGESTPAEVLCRGLPIPRYPELRMGLPCPGRLHRLWRESRPDVVHIATQGPLGWSALRVARRLGLPVSTEFRTNFHSFSRHYGIGALHGLILAYLRGFHNAADCTMVPTEALRRELAGLGFERTLVAARGVDTRRFDPRHRNAALRSAWGVRNGDIVAMYVGRIAPEKNLGTVIDAWRSMTAGRGPFDPRVKLVLVGDGPMRNALQAEYPEVIFAGMRTGEDLACHYASADLFVFPSLTETWGNVTAEALASGLPVLAYDVAAAAELVSPGTSGVLVEAGDRAGFLRAAARLAADRATLAHMQRGARPAVLAHDWDSIVALVESSMLGIRAARMPAAWQALPPSGSLAGLSGT